MSFIHYVQVHTLTIKRMIISALEVARVCRSFGVSEVYDFNNSIYITPELMEEFLKDLEKERGYNQEQRHTREE